MQAFVSPRKSRSNTGTLIRKECGAARQANESGEATRQTGETVIQPQTKGWVMTWWQWLFLAIVGSVAATALWCVLCRAMHDEDERIKRRLRDYVAGVGTQGRGW